MVVKKDNIHKNQIVYMVIQAQVGVGILSLPYNIAKYANQDSWISTLVAGVIMLLVILIMWLLCKSYPGMMMFDIFKQLTGNKLGKCLIIGYTIYFMLQSSYVLSKYGKIIEGWILERTPHWIVLSLMVLTSAYIVKDSLQSMIRFFMLVTPLLIVLIALSSYALRNANFLYILPVAQNGWMPIFKGSREAIFSMLGCDLVFFLYPYVRASHTQILKSVIRAHLMVTLLYTYLVFISLVYFMSPNDIKRVPEPFIYMIKSYSFRVIERMDLFFISIWIVSVATSFMYLLLLSAKGLAHLFAAPKHVTFLPVICLLTLITSLWLLDSDKLNVVNNYLTVCHYLFQAIIPALLLFISIVRKKTGDKREEQ
ncbi:GerAB/ArcD/ProY family transporter [Paenibacillus taiwanensis]|uniref:GerAB/ArcD/ProY family transporter n=1 Tax=Paenibacillus taiwanensis TaxID=401638 RepID=UPI0003F5EDB1|nr:GerAB/ArcD/ProY family transporter [Paenibacillus taiwanensis]